MIKVKLEAGNVLEFPPDEGGRLGIYFSNSGYVSVVDGPGNCKFKDRLKDVQSIRVEADGEDFIIKRVRKKDTRKILES